MDDERTLAAAVSTRVGKAMNAAGHDLQSPSAVPPATSDAADDNPNDYDDDDPDDNYDSPNNNPNGH